jgi:hypothetical protein
MFLSKATLLAINLWLFATTINQSHCHVIRLLYANILLVLWETVQWVSGRKTVTISTCYKYFVHFIIAA